MSKPSLPFYDVHTHLGLDLGFYLRGWWPYAATARDLLAQMDAAGIQFAVCFPFTLPSAFDPYAFADEKRVELLPGRVPFDRENLGLVEEVERVDTQRRLIPFAMFHPHILVQDQVRNLEPLVGRIQGLKTQTTVLQAEIAALIDYGMDLMDFAAQHDLPVLLHTSINPADTWAPVNDCLMVARHYPKVRFNLAHSLRFHAPSLRRAAEMPNVWVDCSAHLNHCQLARENSPVVAAKEERVDANYADPTSVLATIHDMLGGKYMWGSDNPYMAWCDDKLRLMYSYADEAAVFHALPEDVKLSMGHHAPRAWLYGSKGGPRP